MNPRKASARYYLFEDMLWEMREFAHLRKRRSMHDLRHFAAWVWIAEKARGATPIIVAKPTNDWSYYLEGKIHLARKHRSIAGVLHELAHALGHRDKLAHGPAFRKRCLRLYKTYGNWSGVVD